MAERVPRMPAASSAAFTKMAHHGSPSSPHCASAVYFLIPRFCPISWKPTSLRAQRIHAGSTEAGWAGAVGPEPAGDLPDGALRNIAITAPTSAASQPPVFKDSLTAVGRKPPSASVLTPDSSISRFMIGMAPHCLSTALAENFPSATYLPAV